LKIPPFLLICVPLGRESLPIGSSSKEKATTIPVAAFPNLKMEDLLLNK